MGHRAHPLPCAAGTACRRSLRAEVVPYTEAAPNQGVQLTASSVRCAPAFGSSWRPALL